MLLCDEHRLRLSGPRRRAETWLVQHLVTVPGLLVIHLFVVLVVAHDEQKDLAALEECRALQRKRAQMEINMVRE